MSSAFPSIIAKLHPRKCARRVYALETHKQNKYVVVNDMDLKTTLHWISRCKVVLWGVNLLFNNSFCYSVVLHRTLIILWLLHECRWFYFEKCFRFYKHAVHTLVQVWEQFEIHPLLGLYFLSLWFGTIYIYKYVLQLRKSLLKWFASDSISGNRLK